MVYSDRPDLSEERESRSTPLRFLVHDRDHRFGEPFDEVFKAEGVEIIRIPWRAPRANAYAERFVRTVRTECLDRIFALSERHLESVLKTYINHYNRERPHRVSTCEYPRADRQSVSQEPRGRSCAATDLVASSTNTTGRRRKPFHEYRTAVLDTAPIEVQGSIKARPGFFESPRQSHSLISGQYARVHFARGQ